MQDKKKTKNIKVRDLKPKKDAKGGVVADVAGTSTRGTQARSVHQTRQGTGSGHSVDLHI
jgi:hypothetical protein